MTPEQQALKERQEIANAYEAMSHLAPENMAEVIINICSPTGINTIRRLLDEGIDTPWRKP